MIEKLIDNMDENYETTKNESRDSVIGFLQGAVVDTFPGLAEHVDSFFFQKEYFAGEKVDELGLINGQEKLNQARQNLISQKENMGIQKAA